MKSQKNKIFVIAEAGVNHNGNFQKALKMVDAAKFAGADAIKFQTFDPDLTHNEKYIDKKFFKQSKKLSLSDKQFKKIKIYCDKKKIEFMSTPFDKKSAVLLKKIGVRRFKISSANINNYPLLEKLKSFKKEIILSTGMATEIDILKALKILGKKRTTLLHCVSIYPTQNNLINLNRIRSLQRKFKLRVGFSDHSTGIGAAIASTNLGITIIEKHFKLNELDNCPDFSLSIVPEKLKLMIDSIREAEISFGNGKIFPGKKELQRKKKKILGVYYQISKKSGSLLLPKDIILQNPSTKYQFEEVKKFFKKKLSRNVSKGAPVLLKDLK